MNAQIGVKSNVIICCGLLFVLALTAWLYWPGLGGPMILDDHPQLGPLLNLDLKSVPYWRGYVFSNCSPLGRPVAMLTFLFNALTSGPDLWGWKYTNLMIHLLTGLTAFWFSAIAWSVSRGADKISTPAWSWGLLVAALWLLHPLNVSTVLYTVQRMTQLSALFCLAGMLAYVSGRVRQVAHRRWGHFLVIVAYALFLPLATFSKENGVLLPVYTLLLEYFLFRFKGDRTARRLVIYPFYVFVAIPGIIGLFYALTHFDTGIFASYATRDFSVSERLLTEMRVLVMYVGEIFLPSLGRLGFFHDDIALSTGWLSPPSTLYSALFLLSLGVAAMLARKRRPLLGFGIAFFFAGQSIESTILPLELMFEHRNYLPMFGLLMAAVDIIKNVKLRGALKLVIGCAFLSAWSAVLALYVGKWVSYPKLVAYATQTRPHSPRVRAALADYLTAQGRYDAALAILANESAQGGRLQSLYIVCRRDHAISTDSLRDEIASLTRPLDSYAVSGLIEIARKGLDDDCKFESTPFLALLDTAISRGGPDPVSHYKLLIYKANYLWKTGASEDAIATLFATQKLLPEDPVSLFLATEWLISMNEMARAHKCYQDAVRIAGNSSKDYSKFVTSVGAMLSHPEKAAHWRKGE